MSDRFVVGSLTPPEDFDVPDDNVGQLIWKSMENSGAKLALAEVETGESATYGQLLRRAELVARRLLHHGCRRGDVIAMFSPNSISWVVVMVAAVRIGAIPATFNPLLTVDEVKHNLQICQAKYTFTTATLATDVFRAAENFHVAAVFVSGSVHPGCVDIESAPRADEQLPSLPSFDSLSLGPNDPFMITYSSGTSGLPKGVWITQRNMRYVVAQFTYAKVLVTHHRQLQFAPFSHSIGCYTVLSGMVKGYTTHYLVRFTIDSYLHAIQDNQIEHLLLVPTVATMMVKSAESAKYSLSCLKGVMSVGAPMSSDLENQLMAAYPGLTVRQTYAMTEVCCCTYVAAHSDRRVPGSVGKLIPAALLKVVDIKTGESLGPRATGEICMKSPSVTLGYVNNPQATAETIDSDGWFHTGDIGYYDEETNVFIVDRLKELIKYNAFQVAPAELEAVLLSHPEVADAGVVGLPDHAAGELPLAWVVRKPNATVTEAELQKFVSDRVAPHMKLRGGVQFMSSIPKTAVGKVLRRQIKEAILKSRI